MKPTHFAVFLFGMLFGCANLLYAQSPADNSRPAVSVPNLSRLNVGAMLQQMQSATAEGGYDAPCPLQIVVQFLQLQPAQVQIFEQLLQAVHWWF